jgi:DNA polymerase III alpha subunit
MITRREFVKVFGLAPFLGCQWANCLQAVEGTGSVSLRELCERSLRDLYGHDPNKCSDGILTATVQNRLDNEIAIIEKMNLVEQFQKLWILSAFLKANRTPFLLRGPANGSLVVFASGLGNVCPLDHGLLIELMFLERRCLALELPPENKSEIKQLAQHLFQADEPRIGPLKLGFLPFDYLGKLKAYSQADWMNCLPNDRKTIQLLQSGRTEGVYQLGSEEMQAFLRHIRPTSLSEVMASIVLNRPSFSLSRPGPLDNGLAKEFARRRDESAHMVPVHPVVNEILAETRGLILYKEQVIQLFHRLGGMTLTESCHFQRRLSMDSNATIREIRDRFLANAANQGLRRVTAAVRLEEIQLYGPYASSKAHAAALGTMAFGMAYLKAHQSQ